jgi:hypothetical protein
LNIFLLKDNLICHVILLYLLDIIASLSPTSGNSVEESHKELSVRKEGLEKALVVGAIMLWGFVSVKTFESDSECKGEVQKTCPQ